MIDYSMFIKFQQIARSGSFSKAAEVLFVTRSALVQQTKLTEAKLGFAVFNRTPKGVTLTAAGKVFLEEGDLIAKSFERLHQKCVHMAMQNQQVITIGTLANMESAVFHTVCQEFKKKYPNVIVNFKEYRSHEYFPAFLAGEFDVTSEYTFDFLFKYHDIPNLRFYKMKPLRHSIYVPRKSPLASLQKIGCQDLRGQNLIMHSSGRTRSDDVMRHYLEANEPEIRIIDVDYYHRELPLKCLLENAVLLTCENYRFNSPDFVLIPTDWDVTIERGICYFEDCNPTVRNFLQEVSQLIDKANL